MGSVHDMQSARSTYEGMLNLFKFGTPVVCALTALVIFLLTH